MQIEGYCLKCKVKRELSNARVVTLKNGRPAAKGNCPVCGRALMTFLSARAARVWQQLDKGDVEKKRKDDVTGTASMRIVHCIPGRVRLRLHPESPQPNLDDFLIDGVKKVDFTSITKSLLIIYDAKMALEDLLPGIEEKMPPLSWSTTTGQMRVVREKPEAAEEVEEQETPEEVEEEEQETAEATGAVASAPSLFPFSLIAVGLVILIGIDPPIVPAYALMWVMFLSRRKFSSRNLVVGR